MSELQPLDDETVSANGSARCHFRFRLEQLAVARADNGGSCKCAVYKHLFKNLRIIIDATKQSVQARSQWQATGQP